MYLGIDCGTRWGIGALVFGVANAVAIGITIHRLRLFSRATKGITQSNQ